MVFDPDNFQPASGRTLKPTCADEPAAEEKLIFHPEIMFFHFVGVGQTSDWQPLTIHNPTEQAIAVLDFDTNGEFEIQGAAPVQVLPSQVLTVQVRFKPVGSGARLGNIEIEAGTVGKEPRVTLIGIGGLLTGSLVPDPSTVHQIVTDFIEGKWAYRYGSFAVTPFLENEILLDYHVSTAHTLQPNFAGCRFSVTTPPTVQMVFTVHRGVVQIGTITVNPDGTIIAATTGGLAQAIPVDSIITVQAPAFENEYIDRLRMTFVGIV